jgi:hypothetical protein
MFSLDVTPQLIPPRTFILVELSSYSLSVATTILSTVIIVIRILQVSRMPGASRQLRIAMEIIVESAVLYSISALVYTAIISSEPTLASDTETYAQYIDLFFAYMAVASHSPYFLFLVL